MTSKPGRLAVGILGAGRVGAVLGSALRATGHDVVAVSGSSPATLDRIDALLPGIPVLDMVEVARRADLVLVCVPDDAIGRVTSWVAQQGGFRPGQLVVHTSGRYGTEVLRPAIDAGAIALAIHPAMTFTGTSIDLSRLEGTPFAVTAPAPVQPIGQALVVELGGDPVLLPEAARPGYHAALAHASNHLVTLLAQAQAVLRSCGAQAAFDGEGSEASVARLLGPLARAALDGVLAQGAGALTGPVSRGDAGTVADHLSALAALEAAAGSEVAALGTLATYRVLADATARLAGEAGRIPAETVAAVRRLVREVPDGAASSGGPPATAPDRPGGVAVAPTVAALREARSRMAGEVAVVPTMGALHAGHLALVRAARRVAEHVVVTVFVNPTQFGDPTDLAAYPRTLDADLAALAGLGPDAPDLVFAPSAAEMYPDGATRVTLDPGLLAARLEGASRPGHFSGVLTVVAKLLHLVQPDVAVFGEKDAQQLALVRRMVRDLDMPLWVLGVPVVREADGLAMSSRNGRLSAEGRRRALALSRSVAAAQRHAAAGADLGRTLAAARTELDEPGVEVDYAAIVDPETFDELAQLPRVGPDLPAGAARVVVTPAAPVSAVGPRYVVAAVVDGVRLIDNGALAVDPPAAAAEEGSVSSPGD